MNKNLFLVLLCTTIFSIKSVAQHSVAREWNEVLLEAIRLDYARPTVHARNLFHSSIIMYDAWSIFDETAETVFLGKNYGDYYCSFEGIPTTIDIERARHEVISYAMFRLLNHRFKNSPGAATSLENFRNLFLSYNYDENITSLDYSTTNSYASLGNYLASEIIAFGMQDGSNEENDYRNQHYLYSNDPIILEQYKDTNDLNFPDRWQPLAFDLFIDQSGNPQPSSIPDFLSPEWGEVTPFSLKKEDLEILNNGFESTFYDGFDSYVYNNPGDPVYIQNSNENGIEDPYKWHFSLVAQWSSQLDPNDPTLIDISPGALGNVDIANYPKTFEEYKNFYKFYEGGDIGTGHSLNPATNAPYMPQLVKRADYARVLAEFWADGPDSETPPGHWFTILNYVNDHPETIKRLEGQGAILNDLEWDVKSYLALGGAMHDSAVNTWGIKGYYDYIRPISAIRYMAGKGQSTDSSLPSYDPHGIPLIPGSIELIESGDVLAGDNNENVGKIKIYAWKGPDFIQDPITDIAGVDWILGTHWWPYQRGTFVTPPFAGYVSGHSTFSRAASEVLTMLTGDAFFPGGMGTFNIEENNFLVFENGPSEDITLQWATYRDASDQTSLSRIWGGIHPPIDDIRGRIIGEKIGIESFNLAQKYFDGIALSPENLSLNITNEDCINPNNGKILISSLNKTLDFKFSLNNKDYTFKNELEIENLEPGSYSFCVTPIKNIDFEQCFDFIIEKANLLQVKLETNNGEYINEANIEIVYGTPPFNITINNAFFVQENKNNFRINIKEGDKIKITSGILCEGNFNQTIASKNNAIIYPNPTNLSSNIFIPEEVGKVFAEIFNAQGQLVSYKNYTVENNEIRVESEFLPSGVYYINLHLTKPKTVTLIKN
ncbi:T9SS type A sorting domain-containing protein [uncultured Maribacter sp.]|uniref:T9SS type A sorting domain-containing protein n=1 Tax=uncultured Maribacter sp. TaxID=431308 RepID=UPI00261C413D|nr:T9SS type A sorting domain-containing protein [uncultured Maribacter sp.]